jgi:hypothetical protein
VKTPVSKPRAVTHLDGLEDRSASVRFWPILFSNFGACRQLLPTVSAGLLKAEQGVSFEDVVFHLMVGDVLDTVDHPNQERYPGQQIHVIAIEEYVYLVPFVESEEEVLQRGDLLEVALEQFPERGRLGLCALDECALVHLDLDRTRPLLGLGTGLEGLGLSPGAAGPVDRSIAGAIIMTIVI